MTASLVYVELFCWLAHPDSPHCPLLICPSSPCGVFTHPTEVSQLPLDPIVALITTPTDLRPHNRGRLPEATRGGQPHVLRRGH